MAYIYKIINDINQKIYIGKTEFSIEKRWNEHCNDYYKTSIEKRPLYSAMRKYGIKHFHIELIEETDNPEEREEQWIEYFHSFKDGYNATLGGDGKKYLDWDLVVETFKQTKSLSETARLVKCHPDTVGKIIKEKQLNYLINQHQTGKLVNQYNLNGEYIQTFPSCLEAARFLKKLTNSYGAATHIADVCKNRRKTAYGYIWKFIS